MPDVKRLQIMIDEDLDQILERMARDEHTSKAALIRRFVRERVQRLNTLSGRGSRSEEMVGSVDIEPVPGENDQRRRLRTMIYVDTSFWIATRRTRSSTTMKPKPSLAQLELEPLVTSNHVQR